MKRVWKLATTVENGKCQIGDGDNVEEMEDGGDDDHEEEEEDEDEESLNPDWATNHFWHIHCSQFKSDDLYNTKLQFEINFQALFNPVKKNKMYLHWD